MFSTRLVGNFVTARRATSLLAVLLVLGVAICWTSSTSASLIVNDTWNDGEILYPFATAASAPSATNYAETLGGVPKDADNDGDIESEWFRAGTGATLAALGAGGPMRLGVASGQSATMSTYFTPEGAEVNLNTAKRMIRLTWVFKTGDVAPQNNSSAFRIALVDSGASTGGSRATSNAGSATPGGAMDGFAIWGNMGETLGTNTAFPLVARIAESAMLSAQADWNDEVPLASDGIIGDPGYLDNSTYTLIWDIKRNLLNNLDLKATMSGPNLGTLKAYATNVAPNGGNYKFDLFGMRPTLPTTTSNQFDTSLFRVEWFVPEPTSLSLLGFGSLALLAMRRRRG